ncbi:MAG: enoyl-CoA hydratase/isomerase family protein [Candidatus Thermoplasmatota archaeon]|nr:enoyl-CoA hydratase/isomerase family protein [Candidatus Thermoplasmatota archaeon]
MNYKTLSYTITNKVGYIKLNRPERLNAFDITLGDELYQVLRSFAHDSSIQCVVITGSGAAFCGGGDVKEMYAAKEKGTFLRDLTRQIHRCVIEIRTMEKPVIAAINGIAYGAGLSLALACDILIASEDTKMNTAFIGIGLAPGCGTQLFTEIVGYQRACEYILTAKTFTAKEALQLGLLNKVVPHEELTSSVEKLADLFRTLPPIAVGKAKMLIQQSRSNDFITHLELESQTAAISATTKDFTEGVTAFVEKRKPHFIGR